MFSLFFGYIPSSRITGSYVVLFLICSETSIVLYTVSVPIYISTNSLLCFHTNFYIICSSSIKNAIGILIGIELNLYIAIGNMLILIIFMTLIQEHCIYFHLFVSSSVSFIGVLEFSKHRSFTSLGRFFPRYFIILM